MLKNTLIAATFAALLAASSAAAEDGMADAMGASGAPVDPTLAEPQDQAPPAPERRRRREPRRRYHGADVVPGYAPGRPADFYSGAVVGEWNYGQPPQQQQEAPPPSPRGLHNGLWYY
ncbi:MULTISPECIES: hypothetical protein [Methylosinus]|nr:MULTISPECIES: hypothetical protein [Methylosinus]